MPIYEYRCNQCQRKFSQLILNSTDLAALACSYCECKNVTKLISAIAVHRSDAARLADIDLRRPQADTFYQDRRNVGLWAQKQMQQSGIRPSRQFEEVVEKARTGKFLEDL